MKRFYFALCTSGIPRPEIGHGVLAATRVNVPVEAENEQSAYKQLDDWLMAIGANLAKVNIVMYHQEDAVLVPRPGIVNRI